MPWSVSDVAETQYDNSHPWDSMYNGLPSADVYRLDPVQQRLVAQARMTADPATPEDVIRANMTAGIPADAGPVRPQPTIETVLSGAALRPPHLYDRPPTSFGATTPAAEASPRNHISIGS